MCKLQARNANIDGYSNDLRQHLKANDIVRHPSNQLQEQQKNTNVFEAVERTNERNWTGQPLNKHKAKRFIILFVVFAEIIYQIKLGWKQT